LPPVFSQMQFNQFTGIIHQSRQIARRKAGQSKRRIIPIVMQRLITYIISDYHRIPLH
jgi:hypothetical protein